tara:strand:+ start:393 stop:623 length:231 start_codon:yes stop_codon:yes gene_type:complete
MSWENILKEGFEDIDSFIKKMKQINITAMNAFKDFDDKTSNAFDSVELFQLRNAIVDMGTAIMNLQKMRNKQEKLQ